MHESGRVRKAFSESMSTGALAAAMREADAAAVGLSGGADSVTLTVLLAEYCQARNIPLYALHVHHGIRGAEADRDADFCRAFCEERRIPLRVVYVDVPAYAEAENIGTEAAARRLRYRAYEDFLRELRGTLGTPNIVLATAHNADDNIETVLFHLLRGSGTAGLCGIRPVRLPFIRPLLGVSGAEIRAFCEDEKLPYIVDSTNADTAYSRNYLRAEVVPVLRKLTPTPETAVTRMTSLLCEDEDYLTAETLARLGDYACGVSAPIDLLQALPPALFSRAVMRLYTNADGEGTDLTAGHIHAVRDFLREEKRGSLSLPHGFTARIVGGMLTVEKIPEILPPPEDFRAELHMGENPFPAYGFGIFIAPRTEREKIYKSEIPVLYSSAIIKGSLFVRFRRAGDRYIFRGCSHDVRKLFNEAHIPAHLRPVYPVIEDGGGILWIPKFPLRDGAGENPDMCMIYYPLNGENR